MKTTLVPLVGDPLENLFQLGKKEADSFQVLNDRVTRLLSANNFLRYGQDIISRARALLKKKDESFFDRCIAAYAEGLGIETSEYVSFLSLFELAAHYGQIYPELKGLIPGCTSLFEKTPEGFIHTRLIDFPLIGIFEAKPRLYYWKMEGRPSILSHSCEGLAPLFFQTIHESGFSTALHHKPGSSYHRDGTSIFKITFEALFDSSSMSEFRKEIKKHHSVTKWGYFSLDHQGAVMCADIDGPATNFESYNLLETSPLIFTNIPLQKDEAGHESFYRFCDDRQAWLAEKLKRKKNTHILDLITDVKDQKSRKWVHPTSTLSTVSALAVNLTKGVIQLKEGEGAMVSADQIVEFSLGEQSQGKVFKKAERLSEFELAWKQASLSQSAFDQGQLDLAYHHLQMAYTLMPFPIWKEIFQFYLYVWDFKNVSNKRELALIYRQVKELTVPAFLKDQWLFLVMRMERRLDLVSTVDEAQLSPHVKNMFQTEKNASGPVFNAWMKLLYPRLEILDVFSPHHR